MLCNLSLERGHTQASKERPFQPQRLPFPTGRLHLSNTSKKKKNYACVLSVSFLDQYFPRKREREITTQGKTIQRQFKLWPLALSFGGQNTTSRGQRHPLFVRVSQPHVYPAPLCPSPFPAPKSHMKQVFDSLRNWSQGLAFFRLVFGDKVTPKPAPCNHKVPFLTQVTVLQRAGCGATVFYKPDSEGVADLGAEVCSGKAERARKLSLRVSAKQVPASARCQGHG